MNHGVTLAEILVVALIVAIFLPVLLGITTGQEREVRWSAHQLHVAALAHGRLGELEGQLVAKGFPETPQRGERRLDLDSKDHKIRVDELAQIGPVENEPGLFRIALSYAWKEPYAGADASRSYATSLLVVNPLTGLRDPSVQGRKLPGEGK